MTWQSSLDSVPEQPTDPGTFRALANYKHDKEERDALPEWQRGYPASTGPRGGSSSTAAWPVCRNPP